MCKERRKRRLHENDRENERDFSGCVYLCVLGTSDTGGGGLYVPIPP